MSRSIPVHLSIALLSASVAAAGGPGTYPVRYEFTRESTAFLGNRHGMSGFEENAPIHRAVAACTVSDGEYRFGEGVDGEDIYPLCQNQAYTFGYCRSSACLYRSQCGGHWAMLGQYKTSTMYALHDNAVVRAWKGSDNRLRLARSTNSGETWTSARWADSGEEFSWLTEGATLVRQGWGFHQAHSGTIIAVEYKLPTGGRYIYRSGDNGVTWSVVHDNGGPDYAKHYHAVRKHEGLGRWVAVTGDGLNQQTLLASDDDGLTWYEYMAPGERYIQPIYLLDYGHPTRLLFGSDTVWQMGRVDVSDEPSAKTVSSVITNWEHAIQRDYCCQIIDHEGLYYASSWTTQPTPRNVVLSVSPDLDNWSVYHRFTGEESGVYGCAGEAAGQLHLKICIPNRSEHFVISPARLALQNGIVVAPRTTNLFTPAAAAADSLDGWINASSEVPPDSGQQGLLECVSNPAHYGDSSIHYVRSDGGYMQLLTPPFPFEIGKTYQARFWVRGRGGPACVAWTRNSVVASESLWFGLPQDEWRQMVTTPIMAIEGTEDLRVRIRLFSTNDNSCESYLDSLQIEEAPITHWHPGEATRATTHLDARVSVRGSWTNVFAIQPDDMSTYLSQAGELHLKTYWLGPQDYMELFFDPQGARFKLLPTIAGETSAPLVTQPQHFQSQAQINFAVRCGADSLSLSIANGQPTESVTAAYEGALHSGSLQIRCYDEQRPGLPHTLFNDVMFDEALFGEQLLAAMNDLVPPLFGDLNDDGQVDSLDLGQLLSHYGATGAVCYLDGDLDGDCDVDLVDLVALSGAYGSTSPDLDADDVINDQDNCPDHWNPDQADCDNDGYGDVCTIAECQGELWCSDYDLDGIPDECEDCNQNGVPDACDVECGTGNCALHALGCGVSEDCNGNAVPDECELTEGTSEDCNANGIPDECDIAGGASRDCQLNGVPDECDIATGTSVDMFPEGGDGIPDECQSDCNENEVPDEADIANGTSADCNGNSIPDECDIAEETSEDCNENGIPDECDIAGGASRDCQLNGLPDECDIANGTSLDTLPEDGDGIPDECQSDCNDNQVPDDVDIGNGSSEDCNGNAVPDDCDIADGTSEDCNENGNPDECDCPSDINHDWSVDLVDLLELLSSYGTTSGATHEEGDLDCDGDVDLVDLVELLGAYGTVCTNCRGDLDGDLDIDLADVAQLLGNYGESSGMTYYEGDMDFDGDVDLADLAELLGVYGTTCP